MARLDHGLTGWALGALALLVAAAGARPYAGSWHDGSRLAAVESLVERNTFCIDGSPFLNPPAELFDRGHPPYDPDLPLLRVGTFDKLLIDGRYYSDKPPLVNLPLAAAYRALMALGAPPPGARPDVFAWAVAILLSGTGFAVAVGCLWGIGTYVGLSAGWRLAWVGSSACSTVLLAYTRHPNTHLAQVGAVALACLFLCRIAAASGVGRTAWGSLVGAGLTAGVTYNLDFGVGPPLALAVWVAAWVRTGRVGCAAACALGLAPLVLGGHALNYAIGGEWLRPLNMNPEYLNWPGSPFVTGMTGVLRTRYVAQFTYALDILFGKKGFLTHNPPLLLALTTGVLVLRRRGAAHRAELLALLAGCAGGWLMYALLSKNHGGWCVSVRWFLPFLVPGFWLLGAVLKERPEFRRDFVVLALWGVPLAASAWAVGPWWPRNVPGYWWVFGGSLLTWAAVRATARRAKSAPALTVEVGPVRRAA